MFTKSDIEKYFIAEKQESMFFLVIGLIAISLSAYFYFVHKAPFQKGLAIPILLIGFIQAVVGYTVYDRSDRQRIDNVYAYDMNPSKLQVEELARMKTVNHNFIVYRWVEIACLTAGIILVVMFCKEDTNRFVLGVGTGLAIQAAIMLTADFFAERRALWYTKGIEEFLQIK
ncbi:hypothetical protein [Flavihumibacter fluvii]|uniref:hypothetical protein n=1 Tax=Flavihumibacter fluvii TaxID=2838157 RepID=UPI001BDE440E|nr:hypothetical protein [Flavihumibacter fluvii]ULQ52282.1 hypothetical protein KJS93_19525 [Flavihumibacter fluvii]